MDSDKSGKLKYEISYRFLAADTEWQGSKMLFTV